MWDNNTGYRRLFVAFGGVVLLLTISTYSYLHRSTIRQIWYLSSTADYTRGVNVRAANPMFELSTLEMNEAEAPKLPVSLPVPDLTLSLDVIMKNLWVKELQDLLQTLPTNRVNIVSSNYLYRDVLVNWLVSAMINTNPPLTNILVLSLDDKIHDVMKSRGILSVCIPPETVTIPYDPTSEIFKEYTFFFITRLTILRLINHWGYDVIHYDTDAMIVKSPEPLLEKYSTSNVIGSTGTFPHNLKRKWGGFTLCMGFIMFRSTPETELLWDVMSSLYVERDPKDICTDCKSVNSYYQDQVILNSALDNLTIEWDNPDIQSHESHGTAAKGLEVTALSINQVCRKGGCDESKKSEYTIWHKGGAKQEDVKMEGAINSGFWYLKDDWEAVSEKSSATGKQWLKSLMR